MAVDPQMRIVREQINLLLEQAAQAAERGGPAAVRALKIVVTDTIPERRKEQRGNR